MSHSSKRNNSPRRHTILNEYAPKNKGSKYVTQNVIKLHGIIDESTIVAEDFNILLSVIEKSRRKNISKGIVVPDSTINQLGFIGIIEYFV